MFAERVAKSHPLRAQRIERSLIELRAGKKNNSQFGDRMAGVGPRWDAFRQLFDRTCARLGINVGESEASARPDTFRRPTRQGSLF